MKAKSILLMVLFVAFLVTPAVITFSHNEVDVSTYFSFNEEENTSKNQQPVFEFNFEKIQTNFKSIHFLKTQKLVSMYFFKGYAPIFLDVVSPPPRLA